jgi:hypothetical protein
VPPVRPGVAASATLSIPGRHKTILMRDDCNRKVKEDQPTLNRVMEILNRE